MVQKDHKLAYDPIERQWSRKTPSTCTPMFLVLRTACRKRVPHVLTRKAKREAFPRKRGECLEVSPKHRSKHQALHRRIDTAIMLDGESVVRWIEMKLKGFRMFDTYQPAEATILENITEGQDKKEFGLEVHPPNGPAFRAIVSYH